MFQLFQSYVAASGFMLQAAIFDVSCVSHTYCECMFQMFHLFLDVCCIQMFSCCKFLCCLVGGEPRMSGLGVRRVGGWRTVVLRSGHAGGMLVLSCPSQLLSVARAEREVGSGAAGGHRDGGEGG
jgi:hypothetical protein